LRPSRAALLLSAFGDALGYRNGSWEFNTSSLIIHREFEALTGGKGVAGLALDLSWRVSDDTILSMATAKALVESTTPTGAASGTVISSATMAAFAVAYKSAWQQMHGRAPGKTTGKAIQILCQRSQLEARPLSRAEW
jgi:ADP-ribosylarginine hydrolase